MRGRLEGRGARYLLGLLPVLVVIGCSAGSDPVPATSAAPATASTVPATQAGTEPAVWPTAGWQLAAPEDKGVDSARLAELFTQIDEAGYAIDGVVVVRHGAIVAQGYVAPYGPQTRHIVHSCTKSIVSTLVGLARSEGLLPAVTTPLLELFPDVEAANVDARKEALTLEHALIMATGVDAQDSYLYGWRGLEIMMRAGAWTEAALSFPMAAEPGSRFDYSNTASYLLSAALQRATGMTAAEYASAKLFGPLGITDYEWPSSPEGVSIGWGRLHLTPHDMAKFGYLMLNGGEWDGAQIVPADWVATATSAHIEAGTLSDRYGYQWWIDNDGYFMALGYAGQYIVVVPDRDAIIVFVSDLPEEQFFVPRDLIDELIIPAMDSSSPLPANPEGVARMEAAIAAWTGV